jgi:hypothetical protein
MAATHLRIVAKRDGFRRAGIAHSSSAKDHPISNFTEEQIEALKDEPNLVVVEVELEPEPKPKK